MDIFSPENVATSAAMANDKAVEFLSSIGEGLNLCFCLLLFTAKSTIEQRTNVLTFVLPVTSRSSYSNCPYPQKIKQSIIGITSGMNRVGFSSGCWK